VGLEERKGSRWAVCQGVGKTGRQGEQKGCVSRYGAGRDVSDTLSTNNIYSMDFVKFGKSPSKRAASIV